MKLVCPETPTVGVSGNTGLRCSLCGGRLGEHTTTREVK